MRSNATVKLYRDGDPVGLGSDFTVELVGSRIPVWLKFSRAVVITAEGMEAVSDGSARFDRVWEVEEGDIVELQDDNSKRFRVEALREIYTAAGTLMARDCTLVRDASVE